MDERESRDVRIILRVHHTERDAWRREAARTGRSLSGWLRTLANGAVARAKKKRAKKGEG